MVGAASWGDPDLLKARDSSTLQPAYADILKVLLDAGGPVDQASLTPPDAKIDVMAFWDRNSPTRLLFAGLSSMAMRRRS